MSVDIPECAPLFEHRKEEEERKLRQKQDKRSLGCQTICCKERELSRDKKVIVIKFKNQYNNNCYCKRRIIKLN